MKKTKKSHVLLIAAIALLAVWSAQLALKYWVFYRIQQSMKTQIEGNVIPAWFRQRFVVQNARFHWEDKVRVTSGDLEVRYQLQNILFARRLRIQIKSKNAEIFLEGQWAGLYPAGKIPLTHFFADVSIEKGNVKEIHQVEADSPVFYFGLKPNKQ